MIDSETKEPVGSSIGGEVRSKTVPIELETDELGEFRAVLPNNLVLGTHQFQLTASSIGYDNKIVAGEIKRGESKRITIELDYNPFEILMDDNGSMSRGWNPHPYNCTWSSPTIRTRRVVDHYATKKVVDHYATKKVFTGRYRKVFVGTKRVVDHYEWRTKIVHKKTWVSGHYVTRHHWMWRPIKVWGVTIGYYPSYESYRRWVSGHWRWYTTYGWYQMPVYKTVDVYKKKPVYKTVGVPVYRTVNYPVYRRERYTAYRNRKYRVTDHRVKNWGSKEVPITITGKNGYEGDVTLTVQAGKGINTSLSTDTIHISSAATATLTISPSNSITGSIHHITVTATGDRDRGKQATYSLDLQTEPKPSRKTRRIRTWTSSTRPDQTGQTVTVTDPEPQDDQVQTETTHEEHGQNKGPYSITVKRLIPDDSWTLPGVYSGGTITTTHYNEDGTVANIELGTWYDMDPSDGLYGLDRSEDLHPEQVTLYPELNIEDVD